MTVPNEAAEGAVSDDVAVLDADVQSTETPSPDLVVDKVETPESPTGPTDVEIYQGLIEKYNADNTYDATEAEMDAFDSIGDKVKSGEMEEPPLTFSKPEKEEDGTKPDSKEVDKPDTDSIEKPETAVTDSVADNMTEAMKKVGAKDVTELPDKIQGLLNKMGESGGKLGGENKALQERLTTLETEQKGFNQLFNDLKENKPEAIKYFTETLGIDPKLIASAPVVDENAIDIDSLNEDDFVDEKQFKLTRQLLINQKKSDETIKSLTKVIETNKTTSQATEDKITEKEAVAGYVDDIMGLVADKGNTEVYGLSVAEAKGLAKQYFENKEAPVNPKMQKIHELLIYAQKKGYTDLNTAHVMHMHEGGVYAKEIIAAQETGQKMATHAPSVNAALSEQQSRGGNELPDAHITDETISQIEAGDYTQIPDEWSDEAGNFIPEKVPTRFHEKVFGRLGPKKR